MATLTVTQSTDFRGAPAETDITDIVFQAADPSEFILQATFRPVQFGAGLISDTVTVTADPGSPKCFVAVDFAAAGSFSAAGWTFVNWNENDQLAIYGTGADQTITGSYTDDYIYEEGGLDHIDGGDGNDTIQLQGTGIAAGTTVEGGAGEADRILIGSVDTTDLRPAEFSGVERLTFGLGNQTVIIAGDQIGGGGIGVVEEAEAAFTASLEVEGDVVDLTAVTFLDWDSDDTITIRGTNTFGNELVGSSQDDIIVGTLSSIDFMTGGGGADTLDGGDGPDVFLYRAGADVVAGETVSGGTDIDTIVLTNAGSIDFSSITIADVEFLDFLDGSSSATVASSHLGSSRIATVSGSSSADALVVTVVAEFADLSGVTFTDWTAGVDTVTINGSAFPDFILGSGQSETISGGAGADIMVGVDGDDTYLVDNTGDSADETTGSGTDLVQSTVSFTLGTGVENLVLTGTGNIDGTGNGSVNAITGNSGNNILSGRGADDTLRSYGGADRLDGGTGADTLIGGNGDDTYVADNAGDTADESSGSGVDVVQSTVTFTLAAGIENLVLNGAAAINGTGNAVANSISGNSAANVISGLGAADTLVGYGGADRLDGGTGADMMAGGNANDTYVVDNTGDTIVEVAGGGTDTVQSTATHALSANVEILVLNGTAAVDGTGNSAGNTLYGNSAVNRLDGNGGTDTMTGFGGADIFVFADGDGADTVTDFQDASDVCDLTGVAGVDEFSDLVLTDTGSGVNVSYGTGSFELANVANLSAIDASDFVFA